MESVMRFSTQNKPISYVKANAAEIIAELNDGGAPIVITQNGEAKAVLQDVREYEQTQETLAMLKIIALAERNIEAGRTRPAREVLEELRQKYVAE
jgi:prevent-host-death family protein